MEYVIKDFPNYNTSNPEQMIDEIARVNYDDPSGFFSEISRKKNLKYDQLTQEEKEVLKYVVINQICEDFKLLPKDKTVLPFDREHNIRFWNLFDVDPAMDNVVFNSLDDLDYVREFWSKDKIPTNIPNDLFISGNIPLRSIIITLNTGEVNQAYDIRIFSDYKTKVQRSLSDKKKKPVLIGGITPNFNNTDKKNGIVSYAIHFDPENESILVKNVAYIRQKPENITAKSLQMVNNVIILLLQAWYGIQVSLLNPITERVYINKRNTTNPDFKVKTNYRKPKIMYVKKYVITEHDLFSAMAKHVSHDIKCTLWYVIGHWRNYKNGKKIWIDGFWKGIDRLKVNKDNENIIRERILDMRAIK